MWKNIVEPDGPQKNVACMCIACCVPKVTNTPSEYVTLTAFIIATMVGRTRLSVALYVLCLSVVHEIRPRPLQELVTGTRSHI